MSPLKGLDEGDHQHEAGFDDLRRAVAIAHHLAETQLQTPTSFLHEFDGFEGADNCAAGHNAQMQDASAAG